MRMSVGRVSRGQLLSVAIAAVLVSAVYVPIHMPLPAAMAVALEITNENTCESLSNVSAEWIGPDICRINSGTILVGEGDILRVKSGVILEIASDGGVQLDDDATLDIDGTITNGGGVIAVGVANIVNSGTFDNGEVANIGPSILNNSGIILNTDTFTVSSDAILNNSGNIRNFAQFTNHGTINNTGNIDNDGTFDNFGEICGTGTINGEISGTQPTTDCEDGGDEGDDEDSFGTITGFKFEDEDGDGEWDTGEVGDEGTLGGVEICAFGDGMEVEVCDVTDPETGEYLLEDLPLDVQLEIYEEVPEGYEQTAPQDFEETEGLSASDGSYFITLDSVETVEDLNFGNHEDDGLLYATDAGGGSLYTIDTSTGEAELVGSMDLDSVPSLAVDPTTGLMYAGIGGGDAILFAVDPTTGETFLVGDTGLGFSAIGAMAFDSEGTLYASVNLAGNGGTGSDHLAIIDTSTGEADVIGPYGECEGIIVPTDGGGLCELEGMEGLSFAPGGTLYGATNNAELYTINLETGIATLVAAIHDGNESEVYIASIQFTSDGTLYAGTAQGVGDFGTIDTLTGLFALIEHTFEESSLGALAFCDPSCESPETGTITGFKFEDEDGDGEWESEGGEGTISGVSICAYIASMEEPILCDETGEDGSYQLDLLAGIDLVISEDVPEGYEQTAPQDNYFDEEDGVTAEDGSYFVTLTGEVNNLDFGNRLDENSLPVANAGSDQTVDEGAAVQLDGTDSSDEETDSDDLEYTWTQVSGQNVTLTGADTASPTFTAPSNVNTVLVFNLTVGDGTDDSTPDSVSITVQGRGDITIKKVEQGTGALLAGSAFTITPNPLTLDGSLVAADNGDDDSDPAAGIIKIQNARFSTYTIVESQVPEGYAKIVNSLTVVVNSGNLAPIATVQNLNVEQDIEETVEVPPPQLDEEQVDNLGGNGATVNGQPVNSTNLPPAVIVPSGTTPPTPQPVVFSNNAPPNTNGSTLFTSFNIPTYSGPDQSIAGQTTYAPPAIVIPKDDGSNFVLTPVIEEVFEEMTMQLTPPASTATSLTSIQSVEIEFGQGGSGIGFSFDLSSEIPDGLPEIEDIEETALFLDVDFVGNVNFSNPDAFASSPAITVLVSRSLEGETLPDGCPDIELYLLNENTEEWEEIDTPERNPAGDTADECSYIVHPEHFSRFAIGGVTGTITNVSTRPSGGGGGSRTVIVDGTFSDSYFAVNPLARIGVAGTTFAAPNGQVDSEFAVGEQVQISTTIRNYQQGAQTYAFIVQILDENGLVQSISWQTGMLDRAQEYTVGQSWLAEAAGNYQVRMFVWNGLAAPDPLSSVEVRMLQVSDTGPTQSA